MDSIKTNYEYTNSDYQLINKKKLKDWNTLFHDKKKLK